MSVTATNSEVYYQGIYWNDYAYVRQCINEKIAGDRDTYYLDYFKELLGGRKFKRALILNCGNGWVERDLYTRGFFEKCLGIDCSETLLAEAKTAAAALPIDYFQMDVNEANFPEGEFDLVINHAACHHIAAIDKVLRKIATIMTADGVFMHYDYVGPHRNQYSEDQWNEALRLNHALPESMQNSMAYPHLPTMLDMDPTEAIHSELFEETLHRYFTISNNKPLGGGLAYLLLCHNQGFKASTAELQNKWLTHIMEKDTNYLRENPADNLFSFIVSHPKKDFSDDSLADWTQEEAQREQRAQQNNGVYYPLTSVQIATQKTEKERLQALQTQVPQVSQSEQAPQSFLKRVLMRLCRMRS